jgi:hypothetical protein
MEQLALLALAIALATSPLQAVAPEGTVTGTLTVGATSVPLAHVYASAQPGFFDKKTEDIRLLLSDVVLDEEARDVFALSHLARDGKAHILEVVLDATGSPTSGAIYSKEFDGMVSAAGMHRFAREQFAYAIVAGRLTTDASNSFRDVAWTYEATFSVPVPRPPSAAERAKALASPPAVAASSYVAAVRRGDLAALLAAMTGDAAAAFRGSDGAARLKQLRADMPPDARVVSVIPQKDGSVVAKVEGHANGMIVGYTLKTVLDAGVWKIGR